MGFQVGVEQWKVLTIETLDVVAHVIFVTNQIKQRLGVMSLHSCVVMISDAQHYCNQLINFSMDELQDSILKTTLIESLM